MCISDWSSDVCSSDLALDHFLALVAAQKLRAAAGSLLDVVTANGVDALLGFQLHRLGGGRPVAVAVLGGRAVPGVLVTTGGSKGLGLAVLPVVAVAAVVPAVVVPVVVVLVVFDRKCVW